MEHPLSLIAGIALGFIVSLAIRIGLMLRSGEARWVCGTHPPTS